MVGCQVPARLRKTLLDSGRNTILTCPRNSSVAVLEDGADGSLRRETIVLMDRESRIRGVYKSHSRFSSLFRMLAPHRFFVPLDKGDCIYSKPTVRGLGGLINGRSTSVSAIRVVLP